MEQSGVNIRDSPVSIIINNNGLQDYALFGILIELSNDERKRVSKMRSLMSTTFLIMVCMLANYGLAQNHEILNKLAHLKAAIERTTTIVRLLPDFSDRTIKARLREKLQEAEKRYRAAVEFANAEQWQKARLAMTQAYALLRQIEVVIKNNPVLKIKFQEQLDRKIQQAEDALRNSRNREALFMLNRAKFFRQKAYSFFKQGRTFAALEYYRLALYFSEQSLKIASPDRDLHDAENWRSYYLDTQMLLERTRAAIENSPANDRFRKMLDRAENEMQEVIRLYERRNYAAAQQKLTAINRALYRLLDLSEKIPQREIDRLQIDMESLEFALQSIDEKLSEKKLPAARQLYNRTENMLRQIQRHIEDNQPVIARRKLFFANQLVLRLYRLVEENPQSQTQEVESRIVQTKQNLTELKQQQSSWENSEHFLDIINSNLKNAENAYRQGDYLQATHYLAISNQLILKYNRLQSGELREQVQHETATRDLHRLSVLLERLKSSSKEDKAFEIRYRNALELYQLAQQAYDNSQWYLCGELTNMAINLLTK